MPQYDIAVIGGGIHGAGVAQAAAAAGYTVVVLEQKSIAGGTSSRSSKLIHGGLRYLANGQLRLVRECLRERALLLKLAPDLVQLMPFYIPVYPTTRRRPWALALGLSLYGVLAGCAPGAGFCRVPRQNWSTLDGLVTTGLQAVFQYWDAQTDDARLTRAVMHSAQQLGADVQWPAQLIAAQRHEEGWHLDYRQGTATHSLHAATLVNAAGPWVNEVMHCLTPTPTTVAVDLVQGTHLVLDAPRRAGIYYVEAPQDGRAVFVMPWRGKTLLGTTETLFSGAPEAVRVLPAERDYLLTVAAHYFPALVAAREIESFAGLRVLPRGATAAHARPRETVLQRTPTTRPHLITIYGGKLTAYRATAARVIAALQNTLPPRSRCADTATLPLVPVP